MKMISKIPSQRRALRINRCALDLLGGTGRRRRRRRSREGRLIC